MIFLVLIGSQSVIISIFKICSDIYFMEKDVQGPDSIHYHAKEGFYGDQGKITDLQKFLDVKKVEGQLDFIIDDGSHHPQHQIISFTFLFEKGLKPGGIYIIEVNFAI